MPRLKSVPLLKSVLHYCLSILGVFAAFWLRQIMDSQFGIVLPAYITFYPAVMLIALILGVGPGILSVFVSALIVDYWIILPTHSFKITNRSDFVAFLLFIGVSAMICLISERMRLSERQLAALQNTARLRESRNLLQLFIEHSMNAVAMFNTDMVYLTASPVWCREYWHSMEQLIGRSHYDVFPDIGERWKDAHRRGMTGETVQCAEDHIVRPDGRVQWLRWEVMPWRRADESVGGIIIFSDDITNRKEAELALRTEHKKLELALASSPDATFITDLKGDLLEYNEAFVSFHRFADKSNCVLEFAEVPKVIEIRDESGELIPLDLLPVPRALRGETGVNVEYSLRRIDIDVSWIGSFNFAPMHDVDGNIIGSVVTARDVTEQKKSVGLIAQSEARFRRLFEENGSIFIIFDHDDGRILDANRTAAEFYGYSRETMRTMTAMQLNRESEEIILPIFKNVAAGNALPFYRVHYLASGEKRYMEILASVIEDNGHKKVFAALKDVTALKKAEQDLLLSEELYRTAFKTSLDAILITEEASGRVLDVNERFQMVVGHQSSDIVGKTTRDLNLWVEPDDRARMLSRLAREGTIRDFEFLFRKGDGEVRHGLMSASLIDISGLRCIHSVLRDVTDEKLAAEKIRTSEERYRIAFQTSIDAIAITRMEDGRYLDVNQRFQEILGYSREEAIGKTSLELAVWEESVERDKFVQELLLHDNYQDLQTRLRNKSGKFLWSRVSASKITINGESCLLSVIRDISETKMAEEQIRNLAFFDPLTGLANRRMLLDRLQRRAEFADNAHDFRVLLFIDLSNFRGLNDAMGQPVGDAVLRETGMRLTSFKHNPALVARIGGNQFAMEFEGLGRSAPEAASRIDLIAEEIHNHLEMPYQLEQRSWNLSCCIGIVVFAANTEDPHLLLQQADIALAQAKSAGRGSTRFFKASLQAAVEARAGLEDEMRQALRNNEFELYYQPQVEMGKVVGAEALLRWNHPRRGILKPASFIQLAEESGFIFPLSEWVVESACRQIAQWSLNPQTADLTLSINISSLDIKRKEFVHTVLDALERTQANPNRLQLEITEGILMANVSETIAKMHVLKKRGLRFSIDDFGTGYSSLAYLKRFPLDELKIDISFVRDILLDNSSNTIAQAIISLGKAMDLVVIAEGVESAAQFQHLEELGCRIFQGYLFGQPMPAQAFRDMVA